MMPETILLVAIADRARRDAVATGLIGRADRVVPCENGRKLVTAMTRALAQKAKVAGVVMDVTLPIIGGKTSSIALRYVEKAFGAGRAPIVFLSPTPPDQNLGKVVAYLKRAEVLVGAEPPDPSTLAKKLEELAK